jgi:hypothetical protein
MSLIRFGLIVLALVLAAELSAPAALAQNATLTPTADDAQNVSVLRDLDFGRAVAITDSVAYVGMPGYLAAPPSNVSGRVAIYKPNSMHTAWQRTGYMEVTGDYRFGYALAAQSTATTNCLAIASAAGKIRLFAKTGSAPWQKTSDYKLQATQIIQEHSLVWSGDTLSVVYWESHVVNFHEVQEAHVVLFKVTPTYQLQYVQSLTQPSAASDVWGNNVSIDGDQMAIAAGTSVYVYTRDSTGLWQSSSILSAPNSGAVAFGTSVSLRGDHMVIGAPYEDENSSFTKGGAAYAYVRQNGQWVLTQRLRPDVDDPQVVGSFNRFGNSIVANAQFVAIVAPGAGSPVNGHLGLYQWQGDQLVLSKWSTPPRYYPSQDMSTHYVIAGAPESDPPYQEYADIDDLYSHPIVAGPPVAH